MIQVDKSSKCAKCSKPLQCPECLLNFDTIKSIEYVLAKGDRVEVIPVKDGVKVIHIKRKEIKLNTDSPS